MQQPSSLIFHSVVASADFQPLVVRLLRPLLAASWLQCCSCAPTQLPSTNPPPLKTQHYSGHESPVASTQPSQRSLDATEFSGFQPVRDNSWQTAREEQMRCTSSISFFITLVFRRSPCESSMLSWMWLCGINAWMWLCGIMLLGGTGNIKRKWKRVMKEMDDKEGNGRAECSMWNECVWPVEAAISAFVLLLASGCPRCSVAATSHCVPAPERYSEIIWESYEDRSWGLEFYTVSVCVTQPVTFTVTIWHTRTHTAALDTV